MSDATEPRPTTPFPADGAAILPPHLAADPLAGDWSEGLRGPVRALGIVEPRLLQIDGSIPPPPALHFEPPAVAPVAEEAEAPDAWGAASNDPLHSSPPPQSDPPSVIVTFTDPPESAPPTSAMPDVTPPSPAPAFHPEAAPAVEFRPDVTPSSPAPAFHPDITPASAAPAFLPDVTPSSPAPAFLPDVTPASAAPAFLPEAAHAPAPQAATAFHEDEGVVELRAEDAADAGPADRPATDSSAHASDSQAWANAIAAAPGTHSGPTPWSEAMAPPPPSPAADPWKDAPLPMPGPQAEAAPSWDQVTAAVGTPALVPPPPAAWDMHPPATPMAAEDAWSAPPPAAEPVTEWKAEAPAEDWQEIKRPQPEMAAPPPANWGTLSSGPDWSSEPPPQTAAADESWGSAPPPSSESAWDAAPAPAAAGAWEAPATTEEAEWTPPAPAPAAASSWSAAPVGASALEQMDSEPPDIEPTPGAAEELFGSVPVGASLSGDESDDLGPPEELASPEEFLKPVELSDDDADLLVPVEEDAPPPPRPPAQTLAAMRPAAVGALEVQGEHRVAVHTRGGRTRRGTVSDIDLGKSQFSLVPQGGGAAEPIYHAEVKAIFFMLAPGEKLKPADGGKVRVTFADGRSIEGHRDGAEAKHGFFLVPADAARTNTRRIYVAREATTDVKDG